MAYADSALAKAASEMRAAIRENPFFIDLNMTTQHFEFQPSPSQEFNGAGMFYFAEFQALMDRSPEMRSFTCPPLSNREVYFCGNLQQKEVVRVTMFKNPEAPEMSCYSVVREDGKIIAWAKCTHAKI